METANINGHEIRIAKDAAEAKQLWRKYPEDRHRIWTVDETWRHCLDDPEQLQEILDKKLQSPGEY